MFCKNCGKEIADNAVSCVYCSTPVETKRKRKALYKRWWFWVLMGFATIITLAAIASSDTETTTSSTDSKPSQSVTESVKEEITYEKVDLRTMLDELDTNALKAEKTYQNKYVEVVGNITNFDSDGSYISIEPVNADAWDFTSVTCDIKNDQQRNLLLEKEVGDTVTIRGQITSIGEFLGYYIKIDEIL